MDDKGLAFCMFSNFLILLGFVSGRSAVDPDHNINCSSAGEREQVKLHFAQLVFIFIFQ
jgi:hypothetical protein